MRLHLLSIICLFLLSTGIKGQIIIDSSDMPQVGSTYNYSVTDTLTQSVDFYAKGVDLLWDFGFLDFQTQITDTFLSLKSTGSSFENSYKGAANLAIEAIDLVGSDVLEGFSTDEIFAFYNNTSTGYELVGYAADVEVSGFGILPLVTPYDATDKIYQFPISNGKIDSSNASLEIDMSLFEGPYYKTDQKRINEADATGTLITPFGTFQTLRVKTTLTATDTISFDTTQEKIIRPKTVIYKWLGKDKGTPLLQITTVVSDTDTIIAGVVYQDSIRYREVDSSYVFAAVGSQWHYGKKQDSLYSYLKLESIGDTIISGYNCKIIQNDTAACYRPGEKIYIYQDKRKMHVYNEGTDTIHLLYDFGLAVGDTFSMNMPEGAFSGQAVIDSIILRPINGFLLKEFYYHIYLFTDGLTQALSGSYIENIGHTQYLFPWGAVSCLEKYQEIRCFTDSVLGQYRFNTSIDCAFEEVLATSIRGTISENIFRIYPTITNKHLFISGSYEGNYMIEIYDLLGKKYIERKISNNRTDVSTLQEGVYLYLIKNKTKILRQGKFIKQ